MARAIGARGLSARCASRGGALADEAVSLLARGAAIGRRASGAPPDDRARVAGSLAAGSAARVAVSRRACAAATCAHAERAAKKVTHDLTEAWARSPYLASGSARPTVRAQRKVLCAKRRSIGTLLEGPQYRHTAANDELPARKTRNCHQAPRARRRTQAGKRKRHWVPCSRLREHAWQRAGAQCNIFCPRCYRGRCGTGANDMTSSNALQSVSHLVCRVPCSRCGASTHRRIHLLTKRAHGTPGISCCDDVLVLAVGETGRRRSRRCGRRSRSCCDMAASSLRSRAVLGM